MLELNKIHCGDCLDLMKEIDDNSIDSIVTDPPYELGFMGKYWDSTGIANNVDLWRECLRVLKPGGHLLSFSGTRTYHRMASAIEDAGFEVRDMIEWCYGCLSEDTEILTKDGWKHYNKINGNNPVFCYNVDKDIFEYHLPTNYFLYENKHTAYRIQSDTTDQIVSRNHRVAVEQDGRIIFKYAETLKQQENIPFLESMPEMGETFGNEYKRTSYKEQILLGLCVKSYIREKEMKTEGIKLYVGDDMSGMLKAIYDEEKETLKVLLEQMQLNSEMKGVNEALAQVKKLMDGTIKKIIQSEDVMTELQILEELRNSYKEEMKVCKSDDKICEMSYGICRDGKDGLICNGTQTACSDGNMKNIDKDGVRSSYKSQCRGQQDGELNVVQDKLRTQGLGELKKYTTTLATITEVEYDGYVWCIEVPTGCFVARRNGKIFITGNSGFPKSLNIGKAVDKLQGNEREVLPPKTFPDGSKDRKTANHKFYADVDSQENKFTNTKGTSEWEGRGTSLKPSHEPICMARKPLEMKTVAENVLKYGTGGINIDESRVEGVSESDKNAWKTNRKTDGGSGWSFKGKISPEQNNMGRFPANLIHDNSEEVRECFPESNSKPRKDVGKELDKTRGIIGMSGAKWIRQIDDYADSGNASRFFKSILYYPKASKSERNKGCEGLEEKDSMKWAGGNEMKGLAGTYPDGTPRPKQLQQNNHPTVKPIALMEYLIKMVTPKGGRVLDPFAGSGTTLVAAKKNGYQYIGCELTEEYIPIIEARLNAIEEEVIDE